jgi:hypothetical protein
MTAFEILDQLRHHGVRVRAAGSQLIVAPSHALTYELRGLIRENKAALLAAIASSVKRSPEAARIQESEMKLGIAGEQHGGCLAACERCAEFASRPGRAPDGWCKRFRVETWSRMPFRCAQNRVH